MKELELFFTRLSEEWVEPLLKSNGFTRRKDKLYYGFFRDGGDVVHRLGCNYRKPRGYDYTNIGISIGVGFKSVAAFLRGCPESTPKGTVDPKRPSLLGGNLGHLSPKKNWHEWVLYADADDAQVCAVGDEMKRWIVNYAFPFFDKVKTVEDFLWYLANAKVHDLPFVCDSSDFHAAAALWVLNRRQEAIDLIQKNIAHLEALAKTQEWHFKRRTISGDIEPRQEFLEFLKSRLDSE